MGDGGGDGVVMNIIKGNRILLFAFTETQPKEQEINTNPEV